MMTKSQTQLLALLANILFERPRPQIGVTDWSAVLCEAQHQTVFPLVFSRYQNEIRLSVTEKEYGLFLQRYCKQLSLGVQNEYQHGELHRMLSKDEIPYVIIKGVSSASYYPDPSLRVMGDVDFLVQPDDLERVKALLKERGFDAGKGRHQSSHIAFHQYETILEMHWKVDGIPEGEKGDRCREYLSNIIATAKLYKTENEEFLIPDPLRHCLIVLVHTASHMLATGIGLRHLCDWAVFVERYQSDEFCVAFERCLRETGLWHFAQLLTQVAIRYLGATEKAWAMESVDESFLELAILDVFAAGNFGQKDIERINEAKLMDTSSCGDRRMFIQAFRSLSAKTQQFFPICRRERVLLPFCCIYIALRHLALIALGRRPRLMIQKMVKGAAHRMSIYQQFRLFE